MKILIVTPFLPYENVPHAGGAMVFEFLKRISKDNEVTLLSRYKPEEEIKIEEIKKYCARFTGFSFNGDSTFEKINSYVKLGLITNRILEREKFDFVQVEHSETAIAINKKLLSKTKSALTAHDVITKPALRRFNNTRGFLKIFAYVKLQITKKLEKTASLKFSVLFVMSDFDKKFLEAISNRAKVFVSPHPMSIAICSDAGERDNNMILFFGAMNRSVNAEGALYFYEKIFPRLKEKNKELKFYIVGNKPPVILEEMAKKDASLIVTGFVEDVNQYFIKARLMVTPLFEGGGIIVKNIKAMSYGLPVVTSEIGAEGIDCEDGKNLMIARDDDEFSEKCLSLLSDDEIWNNISLASIELVRGKYTDDDVFKRRLKLMEQL